MRIAVIGAGYCGIISSIGWSGIGHDVSCIDIDRERIELLTSGRMPFYEDGIGQKFSEAVESRRLRFSGSYDAARDADVIFISVGTPSNGNGSIDLSFVRSCCESLADELKHFTKRPVVAVRSTVIPGTTEEIILPILSASGKDFGISMIPEFLTEGEGMKGFLHPDRTIIGIRADDSGSRAVLEELHKGIGGPAEFTSIRTAEMVKYGSNCLLATKIAFANEMALLSEKYGADIDKVMRYVGMDRRIGPEFLNAGPGFGGSCLPKDVRALSHNARSMGIRAHVLEGVLESNKRQRLRIVEMLRSKMDIKDKTIAVLGLSFKPGTDDIRESPALKVIERLLDEGAVVRAFDPKAMANAKAAFPDINYAENIDDCLKGCDAALLLTAWPEFRKPARFYSSALKDAPLFDGRRILGEDEATEAGLNYFALGRRCG